MANSAAAASISLKIAERSRYPFGSIQNFIASAIRKRQGTQVARESNIGGNVKSNAAASHSFPIDVTLGLTRHVIAHSRKIIAFSKIRHWLVVRPSHETCGKLNISPGFRINNVALRRRKFLQMANETERINTRQA